MKWYDPSSVVMTTSTAFLPPATVSSTWAPGMAEPEASTTVPVTRPENWADRGSPPKAATKAIPQTKRMFLLNPRIRRLSRWLVAWSFGFSGGRAPGLTQALNAEYVEHVQ